MANDRGRNSLQKVKRQYVTEQTKFDKWLSQCQQDETPIMVTFPFDLQPIFHNQRTLECRVLVVDRYFIQLEVEYTSNLGDELKLVAWFPKDVLRAVSLAIT